MAKYNSKKSGQKKVVNTARIYVTATFNNTIITITDQKGNTVAWSSTGSSGFKGSRKSTSYAATIAAENAINQALNMGMKQAEVFIKGPGPGREVALRVLRGKGVEISLIADMTPMPHNGTRARKQRN
jgi:small subunit ribosomal protein S11